MTKISYNERSWAIDLITEINLYVSKNDKTINRAGGETTINTGVKRLFPDVLLYGKNSEILMGWELKMPDTSITDAEFINNAILKANILGVNSLLLWNVGIAVLYVKKGSNFAPIKKWDSLKEIATKRKEIESLKKEWIIVLHNILKDLNGFFDSGKIEKKTFIESFKDSTIIEFILRNSSVVANSLQKSARKDVKFLAEANIWWRLAKLDYPKQNQWEILSKIILVNWINKLLFAHILIAFFDPAKKVELIGTQITIDEAIDIFKEISKECNFWNVFQPQLGEKYLDEETWLEIKQFNVLLNDIELSVIGQELLQDLLQNIIYTSKRKIAGQYTTPMFLARFLTSLTMVNKELSLHDPCCGTGTIARSAYDLKIESGISSKTSLQSIFCSDKVAFPLQIATLALTDPKNIGEIMQIFKEDCTKINIGDEIELKDPYSGEIIKKRYKGVDYIVSNLPFIQQEDLNILNPNIKELTEKIIYKHTGQQLQFSKGDLYSYLPFYLWNLLKQDGKLGIITSNSWLATEWGEVFRNTLNKFYHVENVIISGKGRWFKNADVITTIIIANKRNSIEDVNPDENTNFITINSDLNIAKDYDIQEIIENIIANIPNENISFQKYKTQSLFDLGISWNSLFSDISWVSKIKSKLIPANKLFDINRGERRGWDPMFYPESNHNIENIYIRPVLKSSREIENLTTTAESEAFCCSKSVKELGALGHDNTLSWIKKFEHEVNEKGNPLPKVLERSGCYWHEMKDTTMADFVASMNFDKRIFIAKLNKRSFVNQRLTRFTVKDGNLDLELIHALLNSVLGIFFIESIGFGRGLGALDLSSTRMKKNLKMLNPDLLSNKQKQSIKIKFGKLKNRKILPILEELKSADRTDFDNVVFESFGIQAYKDQIIDSLKTLYEIRMNIRL
ncbi:MAG: Restriction endonuclease BseMII [uncultured bacterium]|nr:MAG: Restriction endonuclease BseMII [uncultured bacterium]